MDHRKERGRKKKKEKSRRNPAWLRGGDGRDVDGLDDDLDSLWGSSNHSSSSKQTEEERAMIENARRVSIAFKPGAQLTMMAKSLAERGAAMNAISTLSCHVPICVLNQVAEEIQQQRDAEVEAAQLLDHFRKQANAINQNTKNSKHPPNQHNFDFRGPFADDPFAHSFPDPFADTDRDQYSDDDAHDHDDAEQSIQQDLQYVETAFSNHSSWEKKNAPLDQNHRSPQNSDHTQRRRHQHSKTSQNDHSHPTLFKGSMAGLAPNPTPPPVQNITLTPMRIQRPISPIPQQVKNSHIENRVRLSIQDRKYPANNGTGTPGNHGATVDNNTNYGPRKRVEATNQRLRRDLRQKASHVFRVVEETNAYMSIMSSENEDRCEDDSGVDKKRQQKDHKGQKTKNAEDVAGTQSDLDSISDLYHPQRSNFQLQDPENSLSRKKLQMRPTKGPSKNNVRDAADIAFFNNSLREPTSDFDPFDDSLHGSKSDIDPFSDSQRGSKSDSNILDAFNDPQNESKSDFDPFNDFLLERESKSNSDLLNIFDNSPQEATKPPKKSKKEKKKKKSKKSDTPYAEKTEKSTKRKKKAKQKTKSESKHRRKRKTHKKALPGSKSGNEQLLESQDDSTAVASRQTGRGTSTLQQRIQNVDAKQWVTMPSWPNQEQQRKSTTVVHQTQQTRLEAELQQPKENSATSTSLAYRSAQRINSAAHHANRRYKRSVSRESSVQDSEDFQEDTMLLPRSRSHQSTLLFVDISGFTKLSTMLDPEELSKAINSYFEIILVEVQRFGGDVLKFAGDAIFVQWVVTSESQDMTILERPQLNIFQCVQAAALCGASVVSKCTNYPIHDNHNEVIATLNVHCGLAVGDIVGVHVGDYCSRREYVFLGDPIQQVSEAEAVAKHGELASSPHALALLERCCYIDEVTLEYEVGKPTIIARHDLSFFLPMDLSEDTNQAEKSSLLVALDNWQNPSVKTYQDLISLYAHPVVSNNMNMGFKEQKSIRRLREERRAVAELRKVYVMFISPQISVKVKGDGSDTQIYKQLNDIINLASRELGRFRGHLRQFIVDDKGLVLIATFGLKGSTFPNMVAERALPCTITISNSLYDELGIDSKIGATIGNVYCGLVGGLLRHEYAVLGPSVNLAARLMCSKDNPGILVDNAVRLVADRSYAFNALPPVKAKGYDHLVPIFEPLTPLVRSWGRVQPHFVGRNSEMDLLVEIAREMLSNVSLPKFVFINSNPGMGKSTMIVHTIEHIQRVVETDERKLLVTKNVSSQHDKLVPFSIFQSVLIDVLSHYQVRVGSSFLYSTSDNGDESGIDHLSVHSEYSLTNILYLFEHLCVELHTPPIFNQLVCQHILGVQYEEHGNLDLNAAGDLNSLVSYMARVIKKCTKDIDLVILALDDVHNMDSISWSVVEELFNTADNFLFLCASRPLTTYKLNASSGFWADLETRQRESGRFFPMELHRLEQDELKSMIAKSLGFLEDDVTNDLQTEVFAKSGGNPQFANEILDVMKSEQSAGRLGGGGKSSTELGRGFGSVDEIILFRVDSFNPSIRNVLNVSAVLGSTFEIVEVLAVMHQMSDERNRLRGQVTTRAQDVKADLDVLVQEGVLRLVYDEFNDEASDSDDEDEEKKGEKSWSIMDLMYTFSHDLWRSTILNLMLDSRKKDIHRVIATTLELRDTESHGDYLSRMKLFEHWKAAGDGIKASALALSIGQSFDQLGLHAQKIQLYEDALELWTGSSSGSKEFGGIRNSVMDSLSVAELEYVSKLVKALSDAHAQYDYSGKNVSGTRTQTKMI